MSFVGSLFGSKSGAGYKAEGPGKGQLNQAYQDQQNALAQQQAFANAVQGGGNQALLSQQGLLQQLQDQANGNGPSVAQTQLAQSTGQNVANQAALAAGQRGAGSNIGLLARQAAYQGANAQQQAAGQASTLRAQETLNARQQLANQQAQLVGQQQGAIQGLNNAALSGQQNLYNLQGNANSANSSIASQNAQNQAKGIGGIFNSLGPALQVAAPVVGGLFAGPAGVAAGSGIGSAIGGRQSFADGGTVENERPLEKLRKKYSNGGKVPGKAAFGGDNLKNDTVPALLSPGEIVIPRSVVNSQNPIEKSAEFVQDEISKKKAPQKLADGGIAEDETPNNGLNGFLAYQKAKDSGLIPTDLDPVSNQAASPVLPDQQSPITAAPAEVPSDAKLLASNSNLPQFSVPSQDLNRAPAAVLSEASKKAPVSDPYGFEAYGTAVERGIGKQQLGLQQQAQAEKLLGSREYALETQNQKNLENIQQNYQKNFDQLESTRLQQQKEIQEGKIDPQKYINSLSTGAKIGNAIGFILSGLGSGLTGQENLAVKYLNDQINRDIDAQKAELGKKENLLSKTLAQYGNLDQAAQIARINQADIVASRIRQVAAGTKDLAAQARLNQAAGVLEQQTAAQVQDIAAKRAAFSTTESGQQPQAIDPTKAIRFLVPKEEQDEAGKEYAKARIANSSRDRIIANFKKAIDENTLVGRGIHGLSEPASIKQLRADILPIIRDSAGKVSEFEQEIFEDLLPKPGDSDYKIQEKLKGLNHFISSHMVYPTLQKYNINPNPQGSKFNENAESTIKLGPPKR